VPGSLTVVGTGIQLAAHLTPEARAAIEAADEVMYLMSDIVALQSIQRLNPNVRSLQELYEVGRKRVETYEAMTQTIVASVERGANVCVAFYGHPGVFAQPAHEAIRRLRDSGHTARMLPGVSTEDCLFADLGVDPGALGCQSYEATDFLMRRPTIDLSAALVLWQVGVVGNLAYAPEGDTSRLPVLVDYLCGVYPPEHEVVLYEAAPFPAVDPVVQRLPLTELADGNVTPATTLYVPPAAARRIDREMVARLGLGGRREDASGADGSA